MTNEEFMGYWTPDNIKIMRIVGRNYGKYLSEDRMMKILFKTILSYKPEKSKFTTHLFNNTKWHCLKRKERIFQQLPNDLISHDKKDPIINDLKGRDYDLIYKRFYENKTYKEIGIDLGISGSRAQVLTKRVLEKIKCEITK